MKKILIICTALLLFSFSAVHKYYLALTEIEYNTKNQSLEFIMSVFIDDIEDTINKDFNIDAQLWSNNEPKDIDKYFKQYLNSHFKVKVNDKAQAYNYIGKEYDGNTIYFYLEIENIPEINSIEIQNNMLVDYFPEQQNLIKVKVNNERKSLFLSKKENSGLLNF